MGGEWPRSGTKCRTRTPTRNGASITCELKLKPVLRPVWAHVRCSAWLTDPCMLARVHAEKRTAAGRPTSTAGCCERFERFRRHERQRGSRRPLATLRMMGSSRLRRRFHEHGGALGSAVAPRSRISRSLPSHQHPRPVHHSLPSREHPHLPAAAALEPPRVQLRPPCTRTG